MSDLVTKATVTKAKLYETCLEKVDQRISMLLRQIESIAESRNSETKSSAGDKFETGRAMMQLEEDKAASQLANANEVRLILVNLDLKNNNDCVRMGSLVTTNLGIYYLSIGLGKLTLDDRIYYCVSSGSPVGQVLLGLKVDERAQFNGQEMIVQNID